MNSRGQNGEAGIHYVQATEVRSFPENKHRDPIQVMKGFDIFASREKKMSTSFPGSLFSGSIVVDNGGREDRPWKRG